MVMLLKEASANTGPKQTWGRLRSLMSRHK